jgi:hypothetical protein
MTSAFSTAAAWAKTSNVMREHNEESITRTPPSAPTFNICEYFQPVFDQLNELNKLKDSLIDEGDERKRRKRNDAEDVDGNRVVIDLSHMPDNNNCWWSCPMWCSSTQRIVVHTVIHRD